MIWPTLPIQEAVECLIDYRGKTPQKTSTGIRLITAKVIKGGRILKEPAEYIAVDDYDNWMRRGLPNQWDVLITTEAPLGELGILRSAQKIALAQRVILLRGKPELLDQKFLFYVMQGDFVQQQLRARATGATVLGIKQSELRQVEVPMPSLDVQRRIASILSAYDDLIENNTRRIEILEEMARRLYEEWFVHFRFPGHEAVSFKESELGEIPAGWEVKSVVDTFQIMGGGTPSKKVPEYWEDGDINWFSPTDLTRSSSAFMEESSSKITELGLKKSSAKLFPENSVMMTSRATIGVVAINTQPAATNQGFITCLPNNEFPLYLMYHWLKDNVETFISLGTGATFKEISKGTFKEIQLAVPPVDVSRAYQEVVGPMMQQVLLLQRKNANLRTQRDLLLPKLVSGEIDVSNILMANDKEVEAA